MRLSAPAVYEWRSLDSPDLRMLQREPNGRAAVVEPGSEIDEQRSGGGSRGGASGGFFGDPVGESRGEEVAEPARTRLAARSIGDGELDAMEAGSVARSSAGGLTTAEAPAGPSCDGSLLERLGAAAGGRLLSCVCLGGGMGLDA